MNAGVRSTAPARRLGDEWIWVGFRSTHRSCSPAEHAGLELERLHVDEIARLLLQAAEFRLRGAFETAPRAQLPTERRGARALEFEAWRASLDEQLEALHADGASLSPRLAELVGACLAAAARTLECAVSGERSAPGSVAADSARRQPLFGERADARDGCERRTFSWASTRAPSASGARAGASTSALHSSCGGAAPRRVDAGFELDAGFEHWPAARDLAQAARVLAPSARSHCALGRAHLAAGDAAAARGCFRAALASTADERLLREAQLALDELCRAPHLSSAVGADAHGAPHSAVPQF